MASPAQPAPPQPVVKETSYRMIFWTVLLFVVIGAAIWWSFTRQGYSGTVESSPGTLGGWTMDVNGCTAAALGDPPDVVHGNDLKSFTLLDTHQPKLKLNVTISRNDAPQVYATSTQDGLTYKVEYDRCGVSKIQASVPPGATALDGSVKLDCQVGTSRLQSNVSFQNCK